MSKIAVKEVGKPIWFNNSDKNYRTDSSKEYIGKRSTVQFISLNNNRTLFIGVDEDGLLKELPVNFLLPTPNPYFPIQKIVGTAVFVKTKPLDEYFGETEDFEIEDLTDEDIEIIKQLLSDEVQKTLELQFCDCKRTIKNQLPCGR